ncbi:hypothetical protein A8B75_04390 [Sphingomonadales bacterium EhC05]|nr:hypothetical protein A8B75_04390 [Sphingomonadales bacterium EhC05]
MKMRIRHAMFAAAGIGALALALPVMGQDSPESLLPPGFGDPAPAPTPGPTPPPAAAPAPTRVPTPAPGPVPAAPPISDSPTTSVPADGTDLVPNIALRAPIDLGNLDDETGLGALDDALQPQYYLPASARRSMAQIGVLTLESGGLGEDAFGAEGGQYLTNLIRNLDGTIVSRWASILLRRTLLSKVNSPDNIAPADWVAERAWRLLLIGEADAARSLTLKVDGGNYTPRLYEVLMQAHLATGDPAGVCPFVYGGLRANPAPTWTMFRPICASLSGEQSLATALLRDARRKKVATGIDYLLAEKTIGAGFDGRRAVTIKWDEVEYFNNWRYGLGIATGVEPPDSLYRKAGRHVQAWRARAPMLSLESRMKAADIAAALGVLSNKAMVDLYSVAYDDLDVGPSRKSQASALRKAYVGSTAGERIGAMRSLWNRSEGPLTSYSAKILTARAAAKIPASEDNLDSSDELIGSMLTAGLDRSAIRWSETVPIGSLGWGLLAVAAPSDMANITVEDLDDFNSEDYSANQLKSKFLLAALAGLGRVDGSATAEFSDDLDIDLSRTSKWTKAIQSAAQRGQKGTVALLTAIGMQGQNWQAMSPLHLFHITRALKQVGLEAEARMIAAEALTRA